MIRQVIKHEGRIPVVLSTSPADRKADMTYATILDFGVPGDKLPALASNEDHKLGEHLRGPRLFIRRLNDNNGWSIVIHPDNGDPSHRVEIMDDPETSPFERVMFSKED